MKYQFCVSHRKKADSKPSSLVIRIVHVCPHQVDNSLKIPVLNLRYARCGISQLHRDENQESCELHVEVD